MNLRHPVVAAVVEVLRANPRATRRALGWSALGLLPTLAQGWAVSQALDRGFLIGDRVAGLLWLVIPVLASAAGAVGAAFAVRAAGEIAEGLRDRLVERVVASSLHDAVVATGPVRAEGVIARLTQQVEIVRTSVATTLTGSLGLVFAVGGALVGIGALSGTALLLIAPVVLLPLAVYAASLPALLRRVRRVVEAGENASVSVQETIAGLLDLQVAGATGWAAEDCGSHIDAQRGASEHVAVLSAGRSLVLGTGAWAPAAVLLLAGPFLLSRGTSAGELAGAVTYAVTAIAPTVRGIGETITKQLMPLWVMLERLLKTSENLPQDAAPRLELDAAPAPRAVEVRARGLSFAYGPHAEPVVRDLELTVRPGEHLAVIGASGIGKSTLVNLICGTLRPDAGLVRVHDLDLHELTPPQRARLRALIPQEAYVFTGTLGDNLRYLRPDATDAMLLEAAEALGWGAAFLAVGGGEVPLNPAQLSAAEKQLFALTRSWLSPAPLIVLDEGTSHLDPAVEAVVEHAFAARPGTLIVVAHRISSARRADRILLLDGTTAYVGTDAELMETSALYRDLVGHWEGGGSVPLAPMAERVAVEAPAAVGPTMVLASKFRL